jgi:hypothetical protein
MEIFPLPAVIAFAFMWQGVTFIGAYLRASHSTSRKFKPKIHHDVCLEDKFPTETFSPWFHLVINNIFDWMDFNTCESLNMAFLTGGISKKEDCFLKS